MKEFQKLLKHLCFAANLSHVVFGIASISFGGMWLDDFPNFTNDNYIRRIQAIPIATVIVGCAVFLISCIAFFAISKEKACWIMICTNLIVLSLVSQMTLIIWIYVNRPGFLKYLDYEFGGIWDLNNDEHTDHRNSIQNKLKCCGLNDSTDYLRAQQTVPDSCCGKLEINPECRSETLEFGKRVGCKEKFFDFYEANMDIIENFGVCIIVIEFITLILTWIFFMRYRKRVHI